MWADTETDQDFLNYGELAEVVALMLADPKMLPLSVGISGGWGTGKSSFLKMVEARLPKQPANGEVSEGPRYIVVNYDAWLYQGYDDARAALMDAIASRLLKESEGKPQTVKERAVRLFRRVDKLRVLGLGIDMAMLAAGMPPPGLLAKGWGAVSHLLGGSASGQDVADAREGLQKGREEYKGMLRPEEKETPSQEIEEFRKEFAELLRDLGAVLVVFIDNLDRCLPTQVIHTLEALRLFLFMGNTAFCVAADEDMVRGSIARHFEGITGNHVRDYLDKLIQVPVRVPRLGIPEITSYLMLLFAEVHPAVPAERLRPLREGVGQALGQAWRTDPLGAAAAARLVADPPSQALIASFEMAERMAPLLANSSAINGNPRIIKRLLNTVRIRARLAAVRRLDVDETMVAKLALFERCMGEKAAAMLYAEIQIAAEGASPLLCGMEETVADEDGFRRMLPAEWAGAEQERFLREWTALQPSLSGVDLRGVSYLSRDTVALVGRRRGLSTTAAEALKALAAVQRLPSRAADEAARSVPAPERGDVMEALLAEMRRHKEWKQQPAEANGAQVLARLDPGLEARLHAFLREVGGAKPPAWIGFVLKSETGRGRR